MRACSASLGACLVIVGASKLGMYALQLKVVMRAAHDIALDTDATHDYARLVR